MYPRTDVMKAFHRREPRREERGIGLERSRVFDPIHIASRPRVTLSPHCSLSLSRSSSLGQSASLPPCPSTRPIRNSNKAVSGVKNVSGPPWITCRKAEPPGHVYLLCSSLLSSPLLSLLFSSRQETLCAPFSLPSPAPLDNVSRLSERNRSEEVIIVGDSGVLNSRELSRTVVSCCSRIGMGSSGS